MKHKLARSCCLIGIVLFGIRADCLAHAPWVTLQNGHYLIKRPNDGDSSLEAVTLVRFNASTRS